MTVLLIDKFEGKIHVFADGRLTSDQYIFSEDFDKTKYLNSGAIFTFCGGLNGANLIKQLYIDGDLDVESLSHVRQDVNVYIVTKFKVMCIIAHSDKDSINMIDEYDLNILPIFDGSGIEILTGAYEALDVPKSKSESQYINKVSKCFKAVSKRIISVGDLYSHKTIKIE